MSTVVYRASIRSQIYRQSDSRWGSLPYPTSRYSFSGNGCGACSILHCIIERDKYKAFTPKSVQPYMKQHATLGNGTTWAGMTAALKYFGMEEVRTRDSMSELWKDMEKGDRVGVLLFGSRRGPDGTCWTSGGHYVAFTGYKTIGEKHYLYMKDSGFRHHDGWYCYEKSMKGTINQIWTCKVPAEQTSKLYTGKLPGKTVKLGDTGTAVKRLQKFLNWYGCSLTVDGVCGRNTVDAIKLFQIRENLTMDGIFGPASLAAAKAVKK